MHDGSQHIFETASDVRTNCFLHVGLNERKDTTPCSCAHCEMISPEHYESIAKGLFAPNQSTECLPAVGLISVADEMRRFGQQAFSKLAIGDILKMANVERTDRVWLEIS